MKTGFVLRRFGILCAALAFAACGRDRAASDNAEPLPPPAYGEEDANPEVFLDLMEVGSRELYAARAAVLAALDLKPGARVGDIGAGTGLYSLMFADAVGPAGAVFAVDIEPRFLKLIGQRAADLDLGNVVSVLGRDTDITLPHASVDVVFIADTYHYFSDRAAIMATVRDALVDGGRLVILDYTLDESHKGDPKRAHVRFGKAGLISEIESYGFRLADEPDVPGLSEIYMVVFEKA
ncbi:MAG: methyltransferase domain-containing protein [Parvularculaceae bacterium]|nr:methyltransferase domain-containing protein [Parvularculaceae bacterium]